jgi:hypothetical protein
MESEILALSTACPIPIPVNKQGDKGIDAEDDYYVNGSSPPVSARRLTEPIAPYQAMPVTFEAAEPSDLITRNLTPALPVIEGELDHEVCTERPHFPADSLL